MFDHLLLGNGEVRREGNNFEVILDGGSIHVDRIFSDASHDVLLIDNACYDVVIAGEESRYHINVLNRFFDVEIIDPRKRALHHAAIECGAPARVLTTALYDRFTSRGESDFADKVLSAMRFGFGGHHEKPAS